MKWFNTHAFHACIHGFKSRTGHQNCKEWIRDFSNPLFYYKVTKFTTQTIDLTNKTYTMEGKVAYKDFAGNKFYKKYIVQLELDDKNKCMNQQIEFY